ncbi:hypothetical protein [Prosthecobacter sp.]|uniref:hypothetical protein n=1 Tax=Prosthecobacter sp. TaxID=1965333 RepID=UPI0037831753
MNAMTSPPPLTSWSDVGMLALYSFAMAAVLHGIRGRKKALSEEAATVCRSHGIRSGVA